MRAVFFDFVNQYAGMPRSTIELSQRIRDEVALSFLDPYGTCSAYHEALTLAGFAVEVLRPRARLQQIGYGDRPLLRLLRSSAAAPGLWMLQRRLGQALRRLDPEVIWTSSFKGLAIIQRASLDRPRPVLFHFRRTWNEQMGRGWRQRALQDSSTHVLCLASNMVAPFVTAGVAPSRVHVVPNAIVVSGTREAAEGALQSPLPEPVRPVRLLLPGTLVKRKGHACAVRALARLVRDGIDATLWLTGEASDEASKEWQEQVRRIAEAEQVPDRVQFLGWRNDMLRLIREASVVVLPSSDEGFPRVLMEAMVLERPVVTTPVGGIPDLVRNGETGWLHAVDDDAGLAEAVKQAIVPERQTPVVAAALAHVREHFSPARQRERALAAFRTARESVKK